MGDKGGGENIVKYKTGEYFPAGINNLNKSTFYQNRLRSADAVTIGYQLIALLLIFTHFSKVEHAALFTAFHVAVILLLAYLPKLPQNKYLDFLRYWNPIIIIPINFTELHFLVHTINPVDMDAALIAIDKAIFGVNPTVWLERLTNPVLTEYFQIVYSTFYFLPIILAVLLYRSERLEEFDFFALIMVYGFYLSYIGYFLVPAVGPRFTLDHLQSFPLKGLFFTEIIRHVLDSLENIQRDAFPSGHTAMTFLTMYYAAKYHKKYFYVLLIIGSSLILSTVYLRYHYVADVLGGIAMACIVIWTAPWLFKKQT